MTVYSRSGVGCNSKYHSLFESSNLGNSYRIVWKTPVPRQTCTCGVRPKMQLTQNSEKNIGLRPYYTLLTRVHAKHSAGQWITRKMSVWGRGSCYFRQFVFENLDGKNVLILFSFNRRLKVEAHQLGTPWMNTESAHRSYVKLHLAVHASNDLCCWSRNLLGFARLNWTL